MSLRAVIFDLGGTLIDWPDYDQDIERRWKLSYDYFRVMLPQRELPECEVYVRAMREAEKSHWAMVQAVQGSSTPTAVVRDGFQRMGRQASDEEVMTVLDGYGQALYGWAEAFPDSRSTLQALHERGYKIGLLSNTWWAASWHNAEITAHNLAALLDTIVYTSDLPHSKPHSYVFYYVAERLGVRPEECVMVGDRMIDDVSGALSVGMRAVWRKSDYPWPKPEYIHPSAVIEHVSDVLPLLDQWKREDVQSIGQ
jgi:putative hydrolase of the HAD superfamily